MIARVQHLLQSSFLRAVAVLTGGQAVATLVPILAAPIMLPAAPILLLTAQILRFLCTA